LRLAPIIRKNTRTGKIAVESKELKNWANVLSESVSNRVETAYTLYSSLGGFTAELHSTQKLWRKSGRPFLIKVGLALIALPDPAISNIVGSVLVAAGVIQMKMRNSALHIEDVYKIFPQVLEELGSLRQITAQQ
jgi:hypothetical protein